MIGRKYFVKIILKRILKKPDISVCGADARGRRYSPWVALNTLKYYHSAGVLAMAVLPYVM